MMSDFTAKMIVYGMFALFGSLGVCIGQMVGYSINTGSGKYTGQIVETRHHGIIFKTDGMHLKTGENSSNFEDFCIIDKNIYEQAQTISASDKVNIYYKKKFSTPTWKCDSDDSNDIVTKIEVIK